eukprot:GFUD01095463.1.p2 GENE.GFUD01095463.1~~GFUD01095463.1.p2  ORF type:complete len:104 (-),score=21.10 GFUD01095463.1:63-374(-)
MEFYPRSRYARDIFNYSWPQNYHNSFWSNYYTNYWHPSSSYYNSFTLPPTQLSHYLYDDDQLSDTYNYHTHSVLSGSDTYHNIQTRARHHYSRMCIKSNNIVA